MKTNYTRVLKCIAHARAMRWVAQKIKTVAFLAHKLRIRLCKMLNAKLFTVRYNEKINVIKNSDLASSRAYLYYSYYIPRAHTRINADTRDLIFSDVVVVESRLLPLGTRPSPCSSAARILYRRVPRSMCAFSLSISTTTSNPTS